MRRPSADPDDAAAAGSDAARVILLDVEDAPARMKRGVCTSASANVRLLWWELPLLREPVLVPTFAPVLGEGDGDGAPASLMLRRERSGSKYVTPVRRDEMLPGAGECG
ncbi:hypothetical protein WOLCODRAFT_25892 [Wolfiporia cocos MD-104 SS10]|uniref:Uncharacterized protein n=1 Tax=Wolfiporia cocos (strain MD-104) TaxID=742152 RepID=A0A2H3JMH7_WOLCO|nr:hypothetical protein WOLCODRAFT_25892 [Wolfiporia cocos MD-104 SS10]